MIRVIIRDNKAMKKETRMNGPTFAPDNVRRGYLRGARLNFWPRSPRLSPVTLTRGPASFILHLHSDRTQNTPDAKKTTLEPLFEASQYCSSFSIFSCSHIVAVIVIW
jgi:hypothetical protein